MSKKPQKPQNQPVAKKQQIVDQQNEPFLRTIAKRVRNINKKLTEIDQLKKKGDLKPEQIEKVNRRVEYEEQRSKLQGIADFYREAYAENAQQYRNHQLQELDQLANALAILRSGVNFKEADKLVDLNKALTESSNLSLSESAKSISEGLRRFANDSKLKKNVETFIAENPNLQKNQQKIEPNPEPVQVAKVEEPQPPQPVVQEAPVVQVVQQQAPVQQQKVQQTQQVVQEVSAQQKPADTQQTEQKAVEGGEKRPQRREYRGPRNNRDTRDDRVPREYKGPKENKGPRQPRPEGQQGQQGERRRWDNQNKQKRSYKPKNQQEVRADSDSDTSLEQPVAREFNKVQKKKLVDEGFTVIGKPKPKAKQGQKQWYDRTHGRKTHHHHQN